MKKQCSAYATSTNKQCRNRSLPGSSYCMHHIEKLPLLLSAILGAIFSAIIGLIVVESYRSFIPSNELLELRKASKELKELQNIVKPVINIAKARYPNMDTEKALNLLMERVEELEKQSNVIRSIEGTIECLITANWTKSGHPGDLVPMSWNKAQFYSRIFENDPNDISTLLFSLNSVRLEKLSDKDLRVKLAINASSSSGHVGQDLDILKKYSHLSVYLPFIHREDTIDGKIALKKMVATLIVNGEKKIIIEHGDNFIIPFPEGSKLPGFRLDKAELFKSIFEN